MRKQKGFSLIELLIVVAIILIIAAIAVPNLLRSRMAANEASAVGSVRTINTSEVTYASTYANVGYTNLAALGGAVPCTATPAQGCLVDPTIAASTAAAPHSGYYFGATEGTPGGLSTAFTDGGTASKCNTTGMRSFYSDDSLVIRYDASGTCPVGQTAGSTAWSPLQ